MVSNSDHLKHRIPEKQAVANNLFAPESPFIGRRVELEEITNILPDTRLLTITGPGGVGKTRLSLEAARKLVDEPLFRDGIWVVDLTPFESGERVVHAISKVVGSSEINGLSPLASLCVSLSTKKMLMILDNAEHVSETCASILSELLSASPDVNVLVTSREPLGLSIETTLRIGPLPCPQTTDSDSALSNESVQLFLHRSAVLAPGFRLLAEEYNYVAQICTKLDGIPLTIELAASLLDILTPLQILERLDQQLDLLRGPAFRSVSLHQKTLRATIDWSYQLLGELERTVFQRLSVFSGGCTLRAAEFICECDNLSKAEVTSAIVALVRKSLIIVENCPRVGKWFRMLESIRQFAWEKLCVSMDTERTRRKHATYYLRECPKEWSQLTGEEQALTLERVDLEYDNYYAAFCFMVDSVQAEEAMELTALLFRYWHVRGRLSEAKTWLTRALSLSKELTAARADALYALAGVAWGTQNIEEGLPRLEECISIWKSLGNYRWVGAGVNLKGNFMLRLGRYDEAGTLYQEALSIYTEHGSHRQIAIALGNLAIIDSITGNFDAAVERLTKSVSLRREVGDQLWLAMDLNNLATTFVYQGCYEAAYDPLLESRTLFHELKCPWGVVMTQHTEAMIVLSNGNDPRPAVDLYLSALKEYRLNRDQSITACCLDGLARGLMKLPSASIFAKQAAKLLGASEAIRSSLDAPILDLDLHAYQETLTTVHRLLKQAEVQALRTLGRATSIESLLEEILGISHRQLPKEQSIRLPADDSVSHSLTEREVEVLSLLTQGLSTGEIASKLFISSRTVEKHVDNLRTKLGLRTRSKLIAWANRNGINTTD